MKLKNCPCCGKMQTTKNAKFIGRFELTRPGMMFNCECGSSFVIMAKKAVTPINQDEEIRKICKMARELMEKLAS